MLTPGDDGPLRLPGGIITGEAVLLELSPASPLTRGLALAIDAAILLAAGIGLVFLVGLAVSHLDDDDAAAAAGLAGAVLLFVGVPTTWEALTRGRSPGKVAAGLRVVRDDGGPVRARHALVRSLVAVGEIWLLAGSPALIAALASPRGKRIGDLLAGTIVVRERAAPRSAPPVPVPPELETWIRSADVARLPDDLALAARTVLARERRLSPASRERLLTELFARVLPLISPPPPPGTRPERMLAAVLGERRERERASLERSRQRRDVLAERSRRLQGL